MSRFLDFYELTLREHIDKGGPIPSETDKRNRSLAGQCRTL